MCTNHTGTHEHNSREHNSDHHCGHCQHDDASQDDSRTGAVRSDDAFAPPEQPEAEKTATSSLGRP